MCTPTFFAQTRYTSDNTLTALSNHSGGFDSARPGLLYSLALGLFIERSDTANNTLPRSAPTAVSGWYPHQRHVKRGSVSASRHSGDRDFGTDRSAHSVSTRHQRSTQQLFAFPWVMNRRFRSRAEQRAVEGKQL